MSEKWKVPIDKKPPDKFWIDFGKFVNASMIYEDTNHYWQTLIRWADILMNRYNNHVVNMMVMDYLDGQSRRSIENERKKDELDREAAEPCKVFRPGTDRRHGGRRDH